MPARGEMRAARRRARGGAGRGACYLVIIPSMELEAARGEVAPSLVALAAQLLLPCASLLADVCSILLYSTLFYSIPCYSTGRAEGGRDAARGRAGAIVSIAMGAIVSSARWSRRGSRVRVPPWQCPSSARAPSRGAPGGSGLSETPRARDRATGRPATALGARASRPHIRRFHRR